MFPNPLRAYRRARKAFKVFNTIRKERKREKLEHEGVTVHVTEDTTVKEVLALKAASSLKSATVGVAGAGVAGGAWLLANPEVLDAIPDTWKAVFLIGYGICVLIARMRTLGR